jgi:hypothetical protein
MARAGLLITPVRRAYGPMKVAYPILAALAAWFAGVLIFGGESPDDVEGTLALSMIGWFGAPVAGALVYARKQGYQGPDPLSSLGRAVITELRAELPADASQARRVALGGFTAMSDQEMRLAIQRREVDSRWAVRRKGDPNYGINSALARTVRMADVGGGDGGDGWE